MIYVLVLDACDHDEQDKMVFASTSKEVVEKKHHEIKEKNRSMQIICKRLKADTEILRNVLPPIVLPDLATAPPRPLVWAFERWNNAYVLEGDEACRKRNAEVQAFNQKVIAEYAAYYNVPQKELEDGWMWYLTDHTYSVVEVESD